MKPKWVMMQTVLLLIQMTQPGALKTLKWAPALLLLLLMTQGLYF